MLLNILSLCFLFTGIQGADLDYVFDDQAEGWLKLYKTPAKWLDAKIRCETEEAVIASPLDARLRDALIDHVGRQNQGQRRTVTAVYTGVQADYSKGDFFSIEGIPIAQLAVGELHTSSVNYGSSESCIVWDLNGYAKLRRVKCEYSFPYVCYKRRTQLELPHSQPTGLKPNYAFDNRDPETTPRWLRPDQESQPGQQQNTNSQVGYRPQSNQPTYQTYRPTYQQTYPTQTSFGTSQSSFDEQSQANEPTYPNSFPQTDPQSNSQQPMTNSQYQPDKMPRNNVQNRPDMQPTNIPNHNSHSKCITNVPNLLVANSNDIPKLLNYITNLTSVTILFADSAHMTNQGSLWHVDYDRNEHNTVRLVHIDANVKQATEVVATTEPAMNTQYNNEESVSNYNTNTGPNIDDSVEETKLTIDEAWPSNPQRNNNDGQGLPQTGMTLEPPTSGGNVPTYSLTPTGGNVSTDSVPPSRRPTRTGYSRFISKAGGRFKLHLQPEIFETASTRCISEGAVIASPLTVDLKNEINNFLTQNSLTSPIFAGVRANLSNGDYYSTEGVSLTSMPVSLNPGTDSDYQSSDSCITMTGNDNIVTSVRCTDTYPYVCLKTSKPVRSCGNSDSAYEYEPKTQGCYKFHNDEKSWTEAYHICKGEGASLAVLNSKDEAEVLKSLFRRYPKNQIKGQYKHSAYMGLRDWKDGKSWTPVQGVKKSFYKGWAPNEPRAAAECSSIGRSGFLYSDSCQTKLSFICEKESEVLYDENE